MDITKKAMLATLSISVWSGDREDKRVADDIASKYGSDRRMGKFKRSLIDPEAFREIGKVRSEARTKHYELTLPWDDSGARILSTGLYLQYAEQMSAYREKFDALSVAFIEQFPTRVHEARHLLQDLFQESEYPNQEMLAGKFGFRTSIKPVPAAEDFRVDISADECGLIRQQITEELQASTELAMQDVVRRIKDAVGRMAVRLREYTGAKDGAFRDTLVSNVVELVDILPGLNITSNQHVASLIVDMRRDLTQYDADTLRDSGYARESTAEKAEAILARMKEYGL